MSFMFQIFLVICYPLASSLMTHNVVLNSSLLIMNFKKLTRGGRLAMLKKEMDSTTLKMEATCANKRIKLR